MLESNLPAQEVINNNESHLDDTEKQRCQSTINSDPSVVTFDLFGPIFVNKRGHPGTIEGLLSGNHDEFLLEQFDGSDVEQLDYLLTHTQSIPLVNKAQSTYDLQKPLPLEDARVIVQAEHPKIVIQENTVNSVDVERVTETLNKTQRALSLLGITNKITDYIVLITTQARIDFSRQDVDNKVIYLGLYNTPNESNDAQEVLAHETAHAYYQEMLLTEFNTHLNGVPNDHFLEPTSTFFNEGVADFTSLLATDKMPKSELKKQLQNMPTLIMTDLNQGTLKADYTQELEPLYDNGTLSRNNDRVHSRILPAALVQFCAEHGINPRDLHKQQLSELEKAQEEVSQTFAESLQKKGKTIEDVKAMGGHYIDQSVLVTHYSEDETTQQQKEAKVKEIFEKHKLKPFEVIAKLMNISSEECAQKFAIWLQS